MLETSLVSLCMKIMSVLITVILYGRMIEIYLYCSVLYCSVSPIPFATMTNREWGQIGNNYLKGLFALGFQGFLIMICVGIYAVLVNDMIIADNLHSAIFSLAAYTVILCFSLFKSGALANTARYSPLQPIRLSSVFPCSNPAHWQNQSSMHTNTENAGSFPAERRFFLGVCTRTERFIQSQNKSRFQSYETAAHLSCGSLGRRLAAFLFAQGQFLFAMYEKHGQPLEVIAKNIIQTRFIRPKERPYRTENLYAVLERQRNLEKEVSAIVKKTGSTGAGSRPRKGKTKADPRRKETD